MNIENTNNLQQMFSIDNYGNGNDGSISPGKELLLSYLKRSFIRQIAKYYYHHIIT